MSNILLIEDEVNVSYFIKKGLEENGLYVDCAFDGDIGLKLACSKQFDIIILDIIIPRMNGIEFCKQYRFQKGHAVPIIMLTALGTNEDIVQGLNVGANDYIIKPFKFNELLARITAFLRFKNKDLSHSNLLEFVDLKMNLLTKTATRSEEIIQLTSKEFRLLQYFMENPLRVLSKTNIIEHVWDGNIDQNSNVVEVYMNFLRNKVDKNFSVKLIHTMIGMGYVLKEE